MLLSLGIEVDDPDMGRGLDFDGWLMADIDHPRRNSQLTNVLADERFVSIVARQIPKLVTFSGDNANRNTYYRSMAQRRAFEAAAEGHPAIHDLWRDYLDGLLCRLETGGLPDASVALTSLLESVRAKTIEQFPELVKRIKAVDPIDNLHRTIRAGILDEYGWDVLDKTIGDDSSAEASYWVFPYVTYLNDNQLVVVRPGSADSPRELVLKNQKGIEFSGTMPVGDDVMVLYRDNSSWKGKLIWMNDPSTILEPQNESFWFRPKLSVSVDEGVFCGDRTIQPGDTKFQSAQVFFFDGERFWQEKETINYYNPFQGKGAGLTEIDPRNGKKLRDSIPQWFEKDVPAGAWIVWRNSMLLPLPEGAEDSPLGVRDGLIGWKLIMLRDGGWIGEGIDGRRITSAELEKKYRLDHNFYPEGMIPQPGGDSYWIIGSAGDVLDSATGIVIADIKQKEQKYYWDGQPGQVPTVFLHLMKPRDISSSKKLRKITKAQTKQLFEAGEKVFRARFSSGGQQQKSDLEAAKEAARKLLPKTPERLVVGLAGVGLRKRRCQQCV